MANRFHNPVWPGYFADPFILRWHGRYYAYGTGESAGNVPAGQPVFPLLSSEDLVRWEEKGGVLLAREADGPRAYWAPVVAERDGVFYLYYSSAPAGRDEDHRLQVATASHPTGPFTPRGAVLPESEGFSIDAHPFCDPGDGAWYLFFAKDYFDERGGTGLAVVPLTPDLLRAAAPSRPGTHGTTAVSSGR